MKKKWYLAWTSIVGLVTAYQPLLPLWYPLLEEATFRKQPLHSLSLGNHSLVGFWHQDNVTVHSDVCPHMGASFSRGGWVNPEGNLHCPYHGFEFCKGRFLSIPDPRRPLKTRSRKPIKTGIPVLPSMIFNDYLYTTPAGSHSMVDLEDIPLPYFPPEHYDSAFQKVSGFRDVDSPTENVVENLLDMLHISYVHSFGSRDTPLAEDIQYEDLEEQMGGRTTFCYQPNRDTISGWFGNVVTVRVENEFYLPGITITRVTAGNVIKTVFTQSCPLSDNKTRLFWTLYRNFWIDPYVAPFTIFGDKLIRFLMEKTIDEDVSILSRVYPHFRGTILTKYDITIRKYREKQSAYDPQTSIIRYLRQLFPERGTTRTDDEESTYII